MSEFSRIDEVSWTDDGLSGTKDLLTAFGREVELGGTGVSSVLAPFCLAWEDVWC